MSVIATGMKIVQWDDCKFNYGCECGLIDAVCNDETCNTRIRHIGINVM